MLADGIARLTIRDAYIARTARPGQFVNLYTHDAQRLAPRPFGVADVDGDCFHLIFALVGRGTREFSAMGSGDSVDVLGPLGNGFDVSEPADYVLVGGGLGVPPLLRAAQELRNVDGAHSIAMLGYRNVHFADALMGEFADALMSIDESEGNVITLLDRWAATRDAARPTAILTCGPMGMMRAVSAWAAARRLPVQASLESRMGCGWGTCVTCTVRTREGLMKTCLDGPVFRTADLVEWEVAR